MKHSLPNMVGGAEFVGTTKNLREKLEEVISVLDSIPSAQPVTTGERKVTLKDVRAILKARRSRSHFFSDELFADPAWDILLELYAAELAQRRITISSLCIGAAVPATTALRWIGALEKRGLIKRHNDPFDGRRVYASLSERGLSAMDAYFDQVAAPSAGII